MFKQIRSMLVDENTDPLSGKVEVDETYIGGRPRYSDSKNQRGRSGEKSCVVGAVERGGRVVARKTESAAGRVLMPFIRENVKEESHIFTDEWPAYWAVSYNNFYHHTINHKRKIYVVGDNHTNSVEGFWSLFKGGIRGVYRNVSPKYLQTYLNEYTFRYNRRHDVTPMFRSFLTQVKKAD